MFGRTSNVLKNEGPTVFSLHAFIHSRNTYLFFLWRHYLLTGPPLRMQPSVVELRLGMAAVPQQPPGDLLSMSFPTSRAINWFTCNLPMVTLILLAISVV